MQQPRPFGSILRQFVWAGAVGALLLLGGCEPSDQRAVETAAASAAQTVVAEGRHRAAAQVIIAKDTAIVSAATQGAGLAKTAVAAAETTTARVKETAEAEIATRIAPKSPAVRPEVLAARDKLKAMSVMQTHWRQVTAPLQNAPGQRSASSYADVIDQFDVDSTELAGRYKAGGVGNADTRCNIFAGDVMRAMGVPLSQDTPCKAAAYPSCPSLRLSPILPLSHSPFHPLSSNPTRSNVGTFRTLHP